MTASPLSGIRVLDISTVMVGPVCSLRLRQYGAEVIKIEPLEGDIMRSLGGASPSGTHSGTYLHLNRGKRAAALDLKNARAIDALLRLAGRSDVFLSNMRPAALERLGLGADTLCARFPRLVHATVTGFGPNGRYRSLPAYDSVLQAVSGVAGAMDRRDGKAAYVPLLLCDHVVGEIAAGAITAALFQRERTGTGSAIEVPMFETMAAFVLQEHMARASFDPPVGKAGDDRLLDAGAAPIRTADGWISVTTNTDAQTRAFLNAAGRPDMIDDPRFRSVADRMNNISAWFALRAEVIAKQTTAYWLDRFRQLDVPAMPCNSLDDLPFDPHLSDVGLVRPDRHPIEGEIRQIRPTILYDGQWGDPGDPAPGLGWETRQVLIDAGLSAEEADSLIAEGGAVQYGA